MLTKRRGSLLSVGLLCAVAGVYLWAAEEKAPPQAVSREAAKKAYRDGNYKVAYEALRKLALNPKTDAKEVGGDLTLAINALRNLGRNDEVDELRESTVAAHPKNWRLLQTAALSFRNTEHYGYIVAGKFYRGHRRGGTGKYVNTIQRDRTRAMQLMDQALPLLANEADKKAAADFHYNFAGLILNGVYFHDSWRLQYLTDLKTLPDYEEGYHWWRRSTRGAPVDSTNKPIYHHVPKSYEKAQTDGERWRWMLSQVVELAPTRTNEVDMMLAGFFKGQFGVQTMGASGLPAASDDKQTGTFALHTLKETETIARLATGVQRFPLPDEFNHVKIYQRVAERGNSSQGATARDALAGEFEDRRQYVKAAAAWRTAIKEYGNGHNNYRQQRLEQVVGNWGRFEPGAVQPAGKGAVVDYRFRNGKKVELTATPIKVAKLLDDVKAYLKNNPNRVDWQETNVNDLGYRLVVKNQTRYLEDKPVATWSMPLKPRDNHVDERVTITTPLDRAGAYLLTGKMENGNTSRVIIWVADTVLVKKMLDQKTYYFVADAVTGQPVPGANVELFGWRQVQVPGNPRAWRVETTNFARNTDKDGQVFLTPDEQATNHNWLVMARKAKDGFAKQDRLAYLGFSGVWYGRRYDPEYHATRTFVITDRPVYRPEHKVHFKAWVRHAKYDQADTSDFADKKFDVVIRNPKGEKVYEKTHTTDEYAGLEGELTLPKTATLGVYSIQVGQHWHVGNFRLEEYKKPEFEVKVEAPKEPIRLGETIEATIQAKYYFGAPVTKAKVKYTVMRQAHSTTWYPIERWDWFYGTGYWWFASDYLWYPGWEAWGCSRPIHRWWWGWRPDEPPELVSENEVEIGPDGVVKVVIDTKPAKELHGDQDHKYTISAEVVDESRRTITGSGDVIVSRKPFKVYAWVDRGFYRAGDTVKAGFRGLTPDRKPVVGTGTLTLYSVTYKDAKPVEKAVETWQVKTNVEGFAEQSIKAAKAGQYRLSLKLTDAKSNTIEGGYVFLVRGTDFTGSTYRFNDLEISTDKKEYSPDDKVRLLINTNRDNGTVLLFTRPAGVYQAPKVIRLAGKSHVEEITVTKKDMPNFFVEVVSVHGGRLHTEAREIVVPPEKRILNVAVQPDKTEYKPGQKATVKVKVTDLEGQPFVGSTVLTVYDRSVEYISGGSNVPEIKEFFWKWRRSHHPSTEHSLARYFGNILKPNEVGMNYLGMFGAGVVEELEDAKGFEGGKPRKRGEEGEMASRQAGRGGFGGGMGGPPAPGAAAPGEKAEAKDAAADGRPGSNADKEKPGEAPGAPPGAKEPTVRKNFADTAVWKGALVTNQDGVAEVTFTMPEQTGGWKVKAWSLGHGTKVGQAEVEVTTKKDLLLRLQAPRFFTQKDEVVLSANVHNYLKSEKEVTVSLELEGGTLEVMSGSKATQKVTIPAGGEKRVDWRVKVTAEGQAVVRMKAITDEDSDAMQMSFPAHVHGMLKMESFSGVIRPEGDSQTVTLTVPKERRPEQTRLEVRYSPTLAGAMVDALPYMVEYPHGCTEQTLNRFLPTVITLRTLQRMKVDLKDLLQKRTNLNAQELGMSEERARQWKRFNRNPVFDEDEVKRMANAGVQRLTNMQCGDGGWGWFSGFGERSYPHTTAVVVHGLQIAKANDIALVPNVLERGVAWLQAYRAQQVQMLNNAPAKIRPWKEHADNLDALVYMVLVDAGSSDPAMRDYLYRDRTKISVYAKAMFGLALHKEKEAKKLAMVLENISQYVVEDNENQTAYLKLPAGSYWWYWYGSEIEANAYYLKLLAATSPKDKKAAGLVKYLLNNRKHATYWNSTRDTALCIEAMADYIKASGEDRPDMTIEVWLDGKKHKEVKVNDKNLFHFDNVFVLEGTALTDGSHKLEIKRKGTGPVYFNAYLTNFTMEDFITKAGLEVKVQRKYYKLERVKDAKAKVPGSRGQALEQAVVKYKRVELKNWAALKSGDLVEVELEIDSKNDYEYLIFEDPRAAGFEPMAVRSGYGGNDMGAYMEVRDDRVCFFCRTLPRGKHSIAYRMRAEIPGKFSALPAKAAAMYAPELKGNSDEIKLVIKD